MQRSGNTFGCGAAAPYLVHRLRRDPPDVAERLARGEFRSVRAAARWLAGLSAGAGGLVWPPVAALAHLKWFEPYDVSTKQVPVLDTLSLPAFWAAIALVLAAFLAATVVENRPVAAS